MINTGDTGGCSVFTTRVLVILVYDASFPGKTLVDTGGYPAVWGGGTGDIGVPHFKGSG